MPTLSWGEYCRVYGTWRSLNDELLAGYYRASVTTRMTNATGDVIIPEMPLAKGYLNVKEGAPSLNLHLPANNDPANSPSGWQIVITITFTDSHASETYVVDTPMGGEVNLRQVILPEQVVADPEPFLMRGAPGGLAELDTQGNLVDAEGNVALTTEQAADFTRVGHEHSQYALRDHTHDLLGGSGSSTVVDVQAFGAVADGVTDDTEAISAAIAEAQSGGLSVVFFGGQEYAVASTIDVPGGVTLRGAGPGTRLALDSDQTFFITMRGERPALENLTIDSMGRSPSAAIRLQPNATRPRIVNCRITNGSGTASGIGVDFRDGVTDSLIEGCEFSGLSSCVRVGRDPMGIRIIDNQFREWTNRAIQVLGVTDSAAQDIWIEGNYILPHSTQAGHAEVRQPIQFNGVDETPFRNVHVNRNTVIGSGTSHGDDARPGSADLISLHRCDGFEVIGNFAVDGGDVGITVAQQCRNGVIADNVCLRNDSVGICAGSASSLYAHNYAITGNTCMDNGLNRMADGPAWASGGIAVRRAQGFIISGNRCSDTQTVPTQNHGMLIQESSDITVGTNSLTGNIVSEFYEANNIGPISKPSAPRVSVMPEDVTVSNSTVLVPSGMSLQVDANTTYRLEGLLRYNSSTTADLTVKFDGPAGAELNWTTGGLGRNAPGSTSVIMATACAMGTAPTIGGGGGTANVDATPTGLLTTGSVSGTLTLSLAQGTAEESVTTLRGGASFLMLTRIKT